MMQNSVASAAIVYSSWFNSLESTPIKVDNMPFFSGVNCRAKFFKKFLASAEGCGNWVSGCLAATLSA
jgi:hypothetical protein